MQAWLLRLDIAVSHGRPKHPQTQGKVDRLPRTLWVEVPGIRELPDRETAQRRFDAWRTSDNHERPHGALAHRVPDDHYHVSPRSFPKALPPTVAGPDDAVRRVYQPGRIAFRGKAYFISHGLIGPLVAVCPTPDPAVVTVWYCQRQVATLDLTDPS